MVEKKQRLCRFEEIPEDGCKGFSIQYQGRDLELFILKRKDKLYAYKNNCPHTGASLNWKPDVFMDFDDLYIQCAIHGARFEVETGSCVWGPCAKQFLIKVKFEIIDNDIYIL